MRPYWTILRDSFHEAMVSRVLWIVLILITLFLAALAPLGVTHQAGSHLGEGDIWDPVGLLNQLRTAGNSDEVSPGKRVWSRLNSELRRMVEKPPAGADLPTMQWATAKGLVAELNEMLARPDFYEENAWAKTPLRREARDLLSRGVATLAPDELARFNRLALEAGFPGQIAATGKRQVRITYAVWDFPLLEPFELADLQRFIRDSLQNFMNFFLGMVGILAAILVTSPIIPQTFEPGAIDLLLSKPVSRSLVFLTKFCGGCAFIGLNAAYMIGGLWLILGARFGIWNEKLIWCIPLYLFLFSIYYGVSGIVGLIWRNAIVCVVMSILFFAVCFSLWASNWGLELWAMNPQRLVKLIPAKGELLAVNQQGKTVLWAENDQLWQEVFAPQGPSIYRPQFIANMIRIAPVYDSRTDRLLAIITPSNGNHLWIGRADQDWRRMPGATLPSTADALFVDSHGNLLATSPIRVFRMQGNAEAQPKTIEILGYKIPLKDKNARGIFVEASPQLSLYPPISAALNHDGDGLVLFDGRKLLRMEQGEQQMYRMSRELDFEPPQPGIVTYAGTTLLLALESGEIRLYDPSDLKLLKAFDSVKSPPQMAEASPDGRWFAVLHDDGRLWLYDAQRLEATTTRIVGQGNISAVAFNAQNHLLVATRFNRVTEYLPEDGRIVSQRHPAVGFFEGAYVYVIHPLHQILPRPGELNDLVSYVLTDEKSSAAGSSMRDLRAKRNPIDVFGIIRNNLAFLAVVLGIGCVYVARRDF